MNDIIRKSVDHGSFTFKAKFELFGSIQTINNAIFDTGCSHSLISLDSLILNKDINNARIDMILDKNTRIFTGTGVDSIKKDLTTFRQVATIINKIKEANIDKDNDYIRNEIINRITMKNIITLSKYKCIRCELVIPELNIDGIILKNINIRIGLCTENANLIGMHIIRELYTTIYSANNKIILIVTKNESDACNKISKEIKEINECLEIDKFTQQDINANYVNLIVHKKEDNK